MSNLGRNVFARNFLKFARYVARFPPHRWVKRVLAWSPPGPRNSGRPPNSWDHKLTSYCRYKIFGNWVDAADDQQSWEFHLNNSCTYHIILFVHNSLFHACAHLGPPCFWRTGSPGLDSEFCCQKNICVNRNNDI